METALQLCYLTAIALKIVAKFKGKEMKAGVVYSDVAVNEDDFHARLRADGTDRESDTVAVAYISVIQLSPRCRVGSSAYYSTLPLVRSACALVWNEEQTVVPLHVVFVA